MEWYHVALIILACLNLIQLVIFFYLRSQKDIINERHQNVIKRLEKLEGDYEDLDRWSYEIDAYLRFNKPSESEN